MVYSILNKEPKLITSLRSDIPEHIEKTVNKALEKEVSKRYQDTQELIQGLKHSPVITFPKAEKSIVVLPFDDLSPDKDNEYFSDGLTEEIISDLSMIQNLLVISRSSAMTYKGTKKKIKEIGRELKVQYALEGSVRKAGNNLRITAQLIDAINDTHLWVKKYSGTLDDVFDIQEKVSRSIVDALKVKINPKEDRRIAERPIENVKAYEYYLKARQEYWRLNEESLKRAQKFLEEGLEIVGENELLYVAMGWIRFQYVSAGIDVDELHLAKAEEYAQKALALNPSSSHAYALIGTIHEQRGNIQEAGNNLKKAIEIDPNNTEALMMLAFVYSIAGKGYAARPITKHLMSIDSFTPSNYFGPIWLHISEGEFDLSLKSCRRAFELDSKNPGIRLCMAWVLAMNNLYEELQKIADLMIKDSPQAVFTTAIRSLQYALQGQKQKTIETITSDLKNLAQTDHIFSYFLANCFALIKEKEMALDWLETAVKKGRIDYPFLKEYDPFLENIRSEPRFKKLMERVKHEWENFEV
jgi:non-specific serine/threonine protein kinase